ncbi:ArsR/SmtB family transcription factor [Chitinophaga rhizophila]|uniref:Metalloregulator ArsR/SmtB family transcription factor n=1 Tax=Chitinophaga rhizophila TaxID=2866212 RepID=A0ABS7GBN1_9BACT|nr:metalloregulator ArsR/SmtB family transcription factor [Chitinophaga rhizophila]MBW8684530.1 metalloregulator ArsR/SmtB family transcription factor [Chitinophaga rhizophila]
MRRDTFQAIADPTRREILDLIACKPLNINALAGRFSISRTAVYKHLRILLECDVIEIKQCGRERYCMPKPGKISAVRDWLDAFELKLRDVP